MQSHSALASGQDKRHFALKLLEKMWTIPGDFLEQSLSAFAYEPRGLQHDRSRCGPFSVRVFRDLCYLHESGSHAFRCRGGIEPCGASVEVGSMMEMSM